MKPFAEAFNARVEEVLDGIARAFPNWPPPGDLVNAASVPIDRMRIEGALSGKRWTELDLSQWFEYAENRNMSKDGFLVPDDLYELSARGFAYYLPAFLTAIFRIKEPDLFLNFLIGRLGPELTDASEFTRQVIASLSGDPAWVAEALHLLEQKYPQGGAAEAAAFWRKLMEHSMPAG